MGRGDDTAAPSGERYGLAVDRRSSLVRSGAMTSTRLWDRAGLPVTTDGRRLPEVASLPAGLPTVAELFDFMRDAELRFATLRMRILERTVTSRGEEATELDIMLRHPGHARVTTSRPGALLGGEYEVWISDGDI